MPHKILVVDDEPANLRLLERLFRKDFNVITASSGDEAMTILEQQDVAMILTDQRMPGMTGIELLTRTADLRPHTVRIILTGYTDVEALVEAINCGKVYKYVTKPWNNDDLRQTVERAMEHYETNKSRHELGLTNERLISKMKSMTRGFMRGIVDALEAKDEYIHGHALRVSAYATAVGRRVGLNETALEHLSMAAFLHDIGKIGTPDHILLKPGPLTEKERAIIRLHSTRGSAMITGIVDDEVSDAVMHHHEHFDGTGYPNLLQGEQIPILSRIILAADAYDSLTSPRPYREACTHEAALEQLKSGPNAAQFDPEIVRSFSYLTTLEEIRSQIASGKVGARLSPFALPEDESTGNFGAIVKIEMDPTLAALRSRAANRAAVVVPISVLPRN